MKPNDLAKIASEGASPTIPSPGEGGPDTIA